MLIVPRNLKEWQALPGPDRDRCCGFFSVEHRASALPLGGRKPVFRCQPSLSYSLENSDIPNPKIANM